jgi:TetR/AcrR family transcriptional repressor of nem operon
MAPRLPTDTRTALMDSARELIQRVGVNAMSYSDLSTAVGIRKASIHHHFPRKEDLILALIQDSRCTYGLRFGELAEGARSAPDKLRDIAAVYETGVRNHKMCLIGMLSTEHASLGDEVRQALRETSANTLAIFERVFLQGLREQSLAAHGGSADMARAFLGFLLGAQILARCSGDPELFARAAEAHIESLRA